MTSRVYEMYREQTAAAQQRNDKGNPSNLPALYADEEGLVKAFMAQLGLGKYRGRGSSTDGGHAAKGYAAAGSISLNGQISGKSRSTNLLK